MLKTKKNLIVGMLCVLLLLLCSTGLLVSQTNIVYAAESSNTENFQMVFPDYGGEKVYATYRFIKLNDEECSVEISNKDIANIAEIPLFGVIGDKEYTVTEIADNGAMSASKLVEVKLTPYIKKIGNMAFANCAKLKYISLFNVNEICNNAFFRCTELETIIIPTSVKVMGSFVFNKNNTQVEVVASQADCKNWTSTWNLGNSLKENYESTAKDYVRGDIMQQNISRAANNSEENIKGIIITYYPTSPKDLGTFDPSIYDKGDEDIIIPPEATYVDGKPYPILAIDDNSFTGSFFNNLIILHSDLPIYVDSNTFVSSQGNNVIFNRSVIYRTIDETSSYESLINGSPSINIFTGSTIKSVILPDDSEIAANMFRECKQLENIFFKTPSEYVVDENGKDEAEQLKDILENLKSKANGVEIPVQVKAIGDNAFRDAQEISYLKINEKMQKVGSLIVGGWNSSQTVFVQNESVLSEYDSETGLGWKSDWYNPEDTVNINFNKYLFTITFDAGEGKISEITENGDEIFSSTTKTVVEYSKEIGKLPTPTRDGYAFRGWEYDSDYKNVIGKNYADATHTLEAKQNLTVQAVWWPVFTVTLKSEDGNETYCSVNVEYLGDFNTIDITDGSFNIPNRKGYTLSFDLNGIQYYVLNRSEMQLTCANAWNIEGDGIIYAHWELIEYTVQYVADFKGHKNENKTKFNIDEDVNYKFITILDLNSKKRLVWECNHFGEMDLDKANDNNIITLKGTWTDIVTRINYNFNGGREFFGEYPTSIKYNESKKIGEPYKFECNFEGWSLNGVKLTDSTLSNQVEEEITLIANWSIRENVSKRTIIQAGTYTITSSGYYTLPYSYSGNISIIIESYVREVHISSSYYRLYTNVSITIKSSMVNPGPCNLYLENIGIKAPSGQAAIYMCRENSSGTSGGSGMIPENPNISAYIPPITVPTFPVIKPTGANYSLSTRSVDVDLNMESCLNLYTYGKVNIYGGSVSSKQYKNAGCAIFCERLKIKHADNLVIYGGDADELSGDAGCGVVVLYSVSLYDTNDTNYNGIIEVLGGEKTTTEMVGGSLVPKKTRTNPVCNLNAT